MPLVDPKYVRRLGGLNEAGDYNLFRVGNDAELDRFIMETAEDVSSWLRARSLANYVSTDTDTRRQMRRGEAYLVLQALCEPLKARKVFGTHWAIDSEESARYEELIDTEWSKLADQWLSGLLISEDRFSAPVFAITNPVDPSRIPTVDQRNRDVLIDTNALAPPVLAVSQ